MDEQTEIPEKSRRRIIEAAEALYLESGHDRLPTIDAVRRRAGCDMNAASLVVREWKQQLITRAAPVVAIVPDSVRKVFDEVLASAWTVAQELANSNLRAAEQAWERERAENERERFELAELWENVSNDLAMANDGVALLVQQNDEKIAELEKLQAANSQLMADVAKQQSRAEQAEGRVEDAELRIDELKTDLQLAREETQAVRSELTGARISHRAELDQLTTISSGEIEKARSELATYRGKAEESISNRDRQIEQLQQELEKANDRAQSAQNELAALKAEAKVLDGVAKEQRKNAATEALRQAERFTHLQAERDEANRQSAHLQGQLDALQRIGNAKG